MRKMVIGIAKRYDLLDLTQKMKLSSLEFGLVCLYVCHCPLSQTCMEHFDKK